MGSKYDDYWAGQLPQIAARVRAAACGGPAVVSVPGLTGLGARQSWHGTADVLAQEVLGSSGAHATSLGNAVAGSGICRPWPRCAFRFAISAAGDMLTITATADHRRESSPAPGTGSQPLPGRPEDGRRSGSARPGYPPDAGGRRADAGEFYRILDRLEAGLGGLRRLGECTGRSGCPPQGLYFFYEDGEDRADGTGRVVRVGAHALTATSRATLWGRLRQHRGHLAGGDPGGGDHRASVFRRHVGAALIRRGGLPDDLLASWLDRRRPPSSRHSQEAAVEREVSRHIGVMPFLWLAVPGRADRGYLESSSIALLSCLAGGPDQPGAGWLGRHAERPEIRESGLWNVHHVSGRYDPTFLRRLAQLVDQQA